MKRQLAVVAMAGAVALAGCNEGLAPSAETAPSTPGVPANQQVSAAVLSVLDQSGWAGMDFGALGATSEFQNDGQPVGAAAYGANAASATVSVPEFWGRIRGEPVLKTRTVTEQGDTAWASIKVDYNGAFLLDLTPGDNKLDITSKPLVESMTQQARFEKTAIGEKGEAHWALVGITPQQYVATDETHRTVKIAEVSVSVNGVVKIDVTDPTAFEKVNLGGEKTTRDMPAFNKGDTVKVVAKVGNTTGTNNTPPTFAFLSSFHADPNGLGWRRMKMSDNGDGSFSLSWVAQQRGKERVIVEALDAQSFVTPTADDYRANVWAIPYWIH